MNIFTISQDYKQESKQYTWVDFILSLFLYMTCLALYYIMGKILVQSQNGMIVYSVTAIVSFVLIGLVFTLCLIRKQKLSTIGLSRINLKPSFRLGILLIIAVLLFFGTIAFFYHSTPKSNGLAIFLQLIYYLVFIAFVEELIFRAYIGTRLYGFFRDKSFSMIMTGLLFVFMHLPFQVVYANVTVVEYLIQNWLNLIFIFGLHFIMQFLYAKYNNIVAPTLFHFIWDYAQWLLL